MRDPSGPGIKLMCPALAGRFLVTEPAGKPECMLNSVCWYFVEDSCFCIHQGYWPVLLLSGTVLVCFWYHGNAGLIKWVWKCFLLFDFLEEFEKHLVESTNELSSLDFVVGRLPINYFKLITFSPPSYFILLSDSVLVECMFKNLSVSSRLSNLLVTDCS